MSQVCVCVCVCRSSRRDVPSNITLSEIMQMMQSSTCTIVKVSVGPVARYLECKIWQNLHICDLLIGMTALAIRKYPLGTLATWCEEWTSDPIQSRRRDHAVIASRIASSVILYSQYSHFSHGWTSHYLTTVAVAFGLGMLCWKLECQQRRDFVDVSILSSRCFKRLASVVFALCCKILITLVTCIVARARWYINY